MYLLQILLGIIAATSCWCLTWNQKNRGQENNKTTITRQRTKNQLLPLQYYQLWTCSYCKEVSFYLIAFPRHRPNLKQIKIRSSNYDPNSKISLWISKCSTRVLRVLVSHQSDLFFSLMSACIWHETYLKHVDQILSNA